MSMYPGSPFVQAEMAYRRERLAAALGTSRRSRGAGLRRRRHDAAADAGAARRTAAGRSEVAL